MSASLGGLLKDYRLQKNLSQLEIAFSLGWKDTSRLSRIEQGRIDKPQRKLIDKICQIMELKREEKNDVLLAGGYLPTIKEIQSTRKELYDFLENWPYPVGIRDFSWRIVAINTKMHKYYELDDKMVQYLEQECPSILEITFHPTFKPNRDYLKSDRNDERKQFLTKMLRAFKYAQRDRTKEKWYISLMMNMMENDLFRELWQRTLDDSDPSMGFITNFAKKTTLLSNNREVELYMFTMPFLYDPRFEIELYTPANLDAFHYLKKL